MTARCVLPTPFSRLIRPSAETARPRSDRNLPSTKRNSGLKSVASIDCPRPSVATPIRAHQEERSKIRPLRETRHRGGCPNGAEAAQAEGTRERKVTERSEGHLFFRLRLSGLASIAPLRLICCTLGPGNRWKMYNR